MPEPTPEYLILLQGILTAGQQQSKATLDLVEVFRHHAAESARRDGEHEAAAQRRHEELRPMLEDYQTEIRDRRNAIAKANAVAIAEAQTANAQGDASLRKIRALGMKLVELALMAALGGGAVAGYLGHGDASHQEVTP